MKKQIYDESFTEKEIGLIDELIEVSLNKKLFATEEELNKILKE